MPRPALQSATSAQALQSAISAQGSCTAEPGRPGQVAAGAEGQAGSRDALERLNLALSELRQLAVRPLLQRAIRAIDQHQPQTASELAIKALDHDERNGMAWYLLGIARERIGDYASSVQAYEAALQLMPDYEDIAHDLGRLATRMRMPEQAEKLFRIYLAKKPGDPQGLNNLACAIRDQGRYDEAIGLLREAILAQPEVPMLWNTLASILSEQGDFATAELFYAEALKFDRKFWKARYNRGNARFNQGDAAGGLSDCDAALKGPLPADERQMMLLARSTMLLALGRVGEGWDAYEARLHHDYSDVTLFMIDRPRWEPGTDIRGKTLMVMAEQGLGDEVLFANVLPDLVERLGPEGRLKLVVERRLVPLFQRTYPSAEITYHRTVRHKTHKVRYIPEWEDLSDVDLWAPIASFLREYRRSVEAYPARERFLQADPARVEHWKRLLSESCSGLKVGLLWKSGIMSMHRARFFAQFEAWEPVLRQKGVTFVNLQYGDCAEELEFAKSQFGVEVWQPPGIDLKQDIDDVAALCCAMDLIVGFSNATFNIGAACGVPSWLLAGPGSWTRLGQLDRYPWYPQARVFLPEVYGEWTPVLERVAEDLADFVAQSER